MFCEERHEMSLSTCCDDHLDVPCEEREPVNAPLQTQPRTNSRSADAPGRTGALQRKCACGGAPGPTGECTACRRKRMHGAKPLPLQPKLTVNQPNDQYEQEADRVADQVMRMAAPLLQQPGPPTAANAERLQTNPTVRPMSNVSSVGAAAPPIVHEVLHDQGTAAGHPLDAATRRFMEARFGHDFRQVRVHTDSKAGESAQAVNAHAYTVGNHIVFAAGKYTPTTAAGRHLLAHELTHVLQQKGESGLYRLQRACGPAAIGSVGGCAGVGGQDITDLAVSSTNLFLFEVGCDEFRAGEEARLRARVGSIAPDETVELHGFASEEGDATFNDNLSCARAHAAADILAQEGVAAAITLFQHGATPGGREDRRSVVLNVQAAAPPSTPANPCAPAVLPNPATIINEYVQLVRCAERAFSSYTPRRMLSLLRQLYYGNQSWSRTRSRFWENVIPCGLALADPRPGLGADLADALRASQVVAGVDIGHVFTGLEAMVCPSSTTELETPGPNVIVSMPNEEFATWGGDLGSAAAHKTHDEVDLGRTRPWPSYFGTAGAPASYEDLEGDIDSYVIRKGLSGAACGATAGTTLPSLTSPISQILHDYYTSAPTTLGGTRTNYARCFVQAIGGTVSGSRITNKAALVTPIRNRVESFARTFYLGLVTVPLFAIGPVEGMRLLQYSWEGTELFLDWLESKL